MAKKISDYVDIYSYPKVIRNHPPGTRITLGDMHGNAIKFLYALISEGVISMEESDYANLVIMYQKDILKKNPSNENEEINLSSIEIQTYLWLWEEIIYEKITCINPITVCLLGDLLADRGQNDYLNLLILDKLHGLNVPVKILLSNHDLEFIVNYNPHKRPKKYETLTSENLSIRVMNSLIQKEYLSKKIILDIARRAYYPKLEAIGYHIEDTEKITILSHAPIGINTIELIAYSLHIPFDDTTTHDLACTIDAINNNFKETLWKHPRSFYILDNNFEYMQPTPENSPFWYIAWNRNVREINRIGFKNKYGLMYANGHHGNTPNQHAHIFNMDYDNILGKHKSLNIGNYNVLIAYDKNLEIELSLWDDTHPSFGSPGHIFRMIAAICQAPYCKKQTLFNTAPTTIRKINEIAEKNDEFALNILRDEMYNTVDTALRLNSFLRFLCHRNNNTEEIYRLIKTVLMLEPKHHGYNEHCLLLKNYFESKIQPIAEEIAISDHENLENVFV